MARYIHEDPLFADEWALRREMDSRVWPPEEGSRTWDVDTAAEAELKASAGVSSDSETAVLRLKAETVLEGLDGYRGRLGQYLQHRLITQNFSRLLPELELIGPVASGGSIAAPVVSHRKGDAPWQVVDSGSWFLAETSSGPEIRQRGDFRDVDYGFDPYFREPQARVVYTAGMAADVSGLPADLRNAVYVMAHRQFDYRAGYLPAGLTAGGDAVSAVLSRYRRQRGTKLQPFGF